MQTAIETAAARKVPPPVANPDESALWSELRALNEEVKVLRSTDLAMRAWLESWGAFITGSIAVKLVVDHLKTPSKFPWLAPIVGAVALALVVDIVRVRAAFRRLAAHEETRLARQRELRTRLGLDEAPVPRLED